MTAAAKENAPAEVCPVPMQLTVSDVAAVFQCDDRTVRKAIKKVPPEITFYEKFGRVYFDPADVLAAIEGGKLRARRNSTPVQADKIPEVLGRIERLLQTLAGRIPATQGEHREAA